MAFLTEAANRGSISTGYDIEYSNKFESDNSEGITRNYDASTGANCIANNSTTNAKKFTVSYWVKKTELLETFKQWYTIQYGRGVPKGKELYDFVDKQYSKHKKGIWHGIAINYDDDEEEVDDI